MDIIKQLASELEVEEWQVKAAVDLIDEGNTIPFIARYRKEVTGSLDDEVLRKLDERFSYLKNLQARKEQIIASIDEQGKLTEELEAKIKSAQTMVEVEDLYLPFRPKKRTRALIAREKGLEPLARLIFTEEAKEDPLKLAQAYVSEEKEVNSAEEALQGAMDIIAEDISENADHRKIVRHITERRGLVISKARDPEKSSVYDMYYDFKERVQDMLGYRVLALNRGEKEKFLSVKVEAPIEEITRYFESQIIYKDNPLTTPILREVIQDSYKRLIAPAIEREVRNLLTEKAEEGAIEVFGKNLYQLLMQAPIVGHVVLGWDPAFRTGCKLAVVDETGKVLETKVIYPTAPTSPAKIEAAKAELTRLIRKYNISILSLGNGTASRESEAVIVELLKEIPDKVSYVIVNEAGASVYSASELATEEFPNFDVGQRSASSIARRLQDPLAELVKIPPQSIGVGQYQHDMNQKRLSQSLSGVVEKCVNRVGVDLNTASAPLLSYVSGISQAVAKNVVIYREEIGGFRSKKELLKVPKLGPKSFEQCAGFLRIRSGENPLDNTGIHPESYKVTEALLEKLDIGAEEVRENKLKDLSKKVGDLGALALELEVGEETLRDIIMELEKPGRDPREDMPTPILKTDVLDMKDLTEGLVLKGTVRNIVDFGVFVDIGVHQDGLVHISEITDKKFIKHPLEAVSVGDIVEVRVLGVDIDKKRISLSMKGI